MYVYTQKEVYMRTNIVLDDAILSEAMRLSKAKTKKEVIHRALIEFVENKKRLSLIDIAGKIKFTDNYDYKSLREKK